MGSKIDFNIYKHDSKAVMILRIMDYRTGEILKKEIINEDVDRVFKQAVSELAKFGYYYEKKSPIMMFIDRIGNLDF